MTITPELEKRDMGDEPSSNVHVSASPAAEFGLSAAWRRGMMHAVERLDMALTTKGSVTRRLAAVAETLDQLAEFQSRHFPATYEEAFALCGADLRSAAGQSLTSKSEGGSSQQEAIHHITKDQG